MSIFTDAIQRPIEVSQPPRRVISLVPSITEALFAFGLGDSVVGVTQFCVEPKDGVATKARVGGTKTLNLAKVRELEPELIIANAEENRQEDVRQLIAGGLKVFVTFPRTVAEAIEMMRQIAGMTGTMEAAKPILQEAEEALAEARSANDKRRRLRVFCPIWRSPWMTFGPGTYTHDVVSLCGGVNIFAHRHERYPRTELTEIARRDPQVILLPDEPYRFLPKHLPELTQYDYISAVRDERIYLLEGKHLCWYGPRMAGSLRFIQNLFWGEESVEQELQALKQPTL